MDDKESACAQQIVTAFWKKEQPFLAAEMFQKIAPSGSTSPRGYDIKSDVWCASREKK